MNIRYLSTGLLMLLVASCTSLLYPPDADWDMKKVTIGMSKEEVQSLAGTRYKLSAATTDPEGNSIEVWTYTNFSEEEYNLSFKNGRLTDLKRVRSQRYIIRESAPKYPAGTTKQAEDKTSK